MTKKHLYAHLIFLGIMLLAVFASWWMTWVDFFDPWWLASLLVLPYFSWVAAKGISGLPSRTNALATSLRSFLFLLLVLALADIQFVKKNNELSVFFLLDHSASIPEQIRDQELAYVNKAVETKEKDDTAGIVVFGADASVELLPEKNLQLSSLHSQIESSYTDIGNAVELAVAAFPANARKKIVIISDGNQNLGNVSEGVRYATGENVLVDVLGVSFGVKNEILVDKLQLPNKVRENEAFDLKVHVESNIATGAELQIYRNGIELHKQRVELKKGRNPFVVNMQIKKPGFTVYTARIIPDAGTDTILENNSASSYVDIKGEPAVLFVSPDGALEDVEYLLEICKLESLKADVISPAEFPTSIDQLQRYDCIVLANVHSNNFTQDQMQMIKANVYDLGVGLIMIGGKNAFGAGKYDGTPIEEILPVRMDIKQKKVIPKGALCIILHTCEFPKGNYWAKKITKAAIDAVDPLDEVGVLFYGSTDQWLFDLTPANNKLMLKNKIDKCSPGDMPSFAPTFKLAAQSLRKSDAMVKHMIVISDGDPAKPAPSDVDILIDAGVTVSTVGINPHSERDVAVLQYISSRTGGKFYREDDPSKLPQIFIKEAKVVKRSLIFNEPFQPLLGISSELTKGIGKGEMPKLMAYVATTAKEEALVSITSDNENRDPILAQWQRGLGKAVAFTSDASSNWGKHWVTWDKYRKVWTQILRWTIRKRERSNLTIQSRRIGNRQQVVIDAIDSKGNFVATVGASHIRHIDNQGHELRFRQTAPGRYVAEFDIAKTGINLINVAYTNPDTNQKGFIQSAVSVSYPPEYKEMGTNYPLLKEIAQLGGKGELLDSNPLKAGIFQSDQPPSISQQPIWEWLLLAVVLIFMIDIICRRVILGREEVAVMTAKVTAIFNRKKDIESDQTMTALLKRKEQVFKDKDGKSESKDQGSPRPAIKAEGDFKERLAKKAASKSADSVSEHMAASSADDADRSAAKPDESTEKKSKSDDPSEDEQGYTNRLLQAKKRAQKDDAKED